jgi:hypothetical protein
VQVLGFSPAGPNRRIKIPSGLSKHWRCGIIWTGA